MAAGLSSRAVGALTGISHVQVIRIERGLARHVDIETLGRLAGVLGHELSLRIHPIGPPVRDKAHVALLERLAARLGPNVAWQTEVPIPLPGDLRSADGVATVLPAAVPPARVSPLPTVEAGPTEAVPAEAGPVEAGPAEAEPVEPVDTIVEAETRLHDVQATERRLRAKQRDLGTKRAILLVADTRHNRRVIAAIPELRRQFPVGTRSCLAAFKAGHDPGADCLVIL